MKHIKLFEAFSEGENPNMITLAFNGQIGYYKFTDQYWPKMGKHGGHTQFKTQSYGFASNWESLQGDGHPNDGKDGLEMTSGFYYPLFKTVEDVHGKWRNGDWVFISYSKEGNEILIIQSNDYNDNPIDFKFEFGREIKKCPQGPSYHTKFNKLEAGQIDDQDYFKIVAVK